MSKITKPITATEAAGFILECNCSIPPVNQFVCAIEMGEVWACPVCEIVYTVEKVQYRNGALLEQFLGVSTKKADGEHE